MKYINITIFSLIALSAFNLHAGEFSKFSDLEESVKAKYEKAYKAQFKIRVSEGTRCTGSYISNEGHGLTASHCIKNCMSDSSSDLTRWPVEGLFNRYVVEPNGGMAMAMSESTHKVTAYNWSYPKECSAVIDGETKQIQVLAGTKGRLVEHMPIDVVFYFKQYYFITQEEIDIYKQKWLESFYDGWGMGADFAIFKLIDELEEPTDCLEVSKADRFSGEHYSLSYPGRTSISSRENNEDLYLSTGDVTLGNYFSSEVIAIEDPNHRYLNTDLWGSPGSSGASLQSVEDNTISGVWSAVVGRLGMSGDELKDGRFVSSKVIWQFAGEQLEKIRCE